MRYVIPVPDINKYSRESLKEEINAAEVRIEEICIGNGVLVLDFETDLTDAEKDTVSQVIAGHKPIFYEWEETGQVHRRPVRCAEDVDRCTGMRIRAAIGGIDPVQEQIKVLTEQVAVLLAAIIEAKNIVDLQDRVNQDMARFQGFLDKRDKTIQEGKTFKKTRGW